MILCVSVRKKKLEEEEAELRRKNTDAAYQGTSFKGCLGGNHQYNIINSSLLLENNEH